jgi:hypothetical protein
LAASHAPPPVPEALDEAALLDALALDEPPPPPAELVLDAALPPAELVLDAAPPPAELALDAVPPPAPPLPLVELSAVEPPTLEVVALGAIPPAPPTLLLLHAVSNASAVAPSSAGGRGGRERFRRCGMIRLSPADGVSSTNFSQSPAMVHGPSGPADQVQVSHFGRVEPAACAL